MPGFRTYGILDTGGGILSVTSCEDKAECEGIWRFEAEGAPPSGGAHVAVRIFSGRPPEGLRDRKDDIRKLMTAVDGFYSYGVMDTSTGGGVSILAGKDKATTDEVGKHMGEFVSTEYPNPSRQPPQIIEGEGLYRFVAQAAPA